MNESPTPPRQPDERHEEFGELIRYTAAGYVGGLAVGAMLDSFGLQRSPVGQWMVRSLSGEGESFLEGFFALRKHIAGATHSLAAAYGWGKLIGMTAPWFIDLFSRLAGVDVYGTSAFYIPYFYAMADQIGASMSGFVFFRRRTTSFSSALSAYFAHPVMIAGLAVILLVPFGLLTARLLGFSPNTQTLTAVETIAANLCWVPPLVGWTRERRSVPGAF